MQTRKYILTIDGGGVRGMIPACALAELEQQAGKRAKDIFSFMAGTSTGSIIVAALALGIPAAEIVTLYRDRVADVFHGNWWWSLPWESMRRLSDALADVPLYPDGASVPWMKSRARLLRGVSHYLDVGARLPGYAYD